MHNRDKYPAIWAEKEVAETKLAGLMAARQKQTDAIKAVQQEIDNLKTEKNRLNDLAMADIDQIREVSAVISRCAIAMGAKTASGI